MSLKTDRRWTDAGLTSADGEGRPLAEVVEVASHYRADQPVALFKLNAAVGDTRHVLYVGQPATRGVAHYVCATLADAEEAARRLGLAARLGIVLMEPLDG